MEVNIQNEMSPKNIGSIKGDVLLKQEISRLIIKEIVDELVPIPMHIHNFQEITPIYVFLRVSSK